MSSLVLLRRWLAWDRSLPVWYDPDYRMPLVAFGKRTGLDPRRADLVAWYLLDRGWLRRTNFRTPTRVRYEDLARVHTPEYLESLSDAATLARIFGVDPWGVPVDALLNCVRLGCGGTLAAARAALDRGGPAVNLVGGFHHAGPNWGAGLCAVNDIAVAVATLRQTSGLAGQVVVLDLDAHPPDGTAACFRGDTTVWVGSLSGSSTGVIAGADETVLPPRCGDAEYLDALGRLLQRMPRPALAFVIAGGDVLGGDHLGHLGLTLRGARRRDLRVAEALRGLPSVWLPGGGYHGQAWRVLAGTALALSHRTAAAISPGRDPMAARFARLARYFDFPREAEPDLSFDDVAMELGIAPPARRQVLLGRYSRDAMEYALFRFGVLPFLERRGYGNLRVTFDTATTGGERVTLAGDYGGRRHTLVDCVLERQEIGGVPALYVHWLSLRDPIARFSDRRPQMPGQEVPGLGLAREITQLFLLASERLGVRGVAFTPAWYHTAYVARERFKFLDETRQGRFEAMVRDLRGLSLPRASKALADGRVLCNGEPFVWEPALMASWVTYEGEAAPRVAAARDAVRFSLAGAEVSGSPA